MLNAMLQNFQRNNQAAAAANPPAATSSRISQRAEPASSPRVAAMDAQAAAGGRRVHGAFDVAAADEDSAPGILQLLVRWGLPAKAANILTEQELASERTAKKLLAALQVQRPTQSSPSVTQPNG